MWAFYIQATPGGVLTLFAPKDACLYHCQQTAEKALKAFLVSKEISPEKTHDIRKLTLEAVVHEPRFNEVMDMAVALTPYAWEFR